jgi:IMP cyclohydrolase
MRINFSSNGRSYTATSTDIFMDNGAKIFFIANGKHANPTAQRVELSVREWNRIKQHLMPVDYEEYYGKKPLMKGIVIYKLNNN